jgi:hypothetical protein
MKTIIARVDIGSLLDARLDLLETAANAAVSEQFWMNTKMSTPTCPSEIIPLNHCISCKQGLTPIQVGQRMSACAGHANVVECRKAQRTRQYLMSSSIFVNVFAGTYPSGHGRQ